MPELLISSLAHRAYERRQDAPPIGDGSAEKSTGKVAGYMYQADAKQSKFVDVRSTFPTGQKLAQLGELLAQHGRPTALITESTPESLGDAVARSVLGIRIERTGNQPASPLSPSLALLQDARGVLVKRNPPDFAEILEAMFALGSDSSQREGQSASALWLRAVDRRLDHDPVLQAIDGAFMTGILSDGYERRPGDLGHLEGRQWAGLFPDTPYSWFARVWSALTSDDWVDSLPARVWVDWATTVLRLTMGLGFLWEAAWYERIAAAVIGRSVPATFTELVASVRPPLPWQSSRATVTTRDVASLIKHRLRRGEKVRTYLGARMKEHAKARSLAAVSAIDFLRELSDEKGHVEALVKSLADGTDKSKTVYETVKYGLQVREASGPYTDYFGVLKAHGRRFVLVDPGTEWVTVVASLACRGRSRHCTVGDVLADLSRLGMRPELGDLVALLERAGMARGSADADNAVIVERAF
ncbi:hypothetical protein [Sinomonas cyclohexanicum]|uniref:hypothetical protein n=1 Tax=Sinomonas cyclohexanicum TaxID=322009 RepID=UPI001E45E54C|nr:hypothetical protein [Corynebacterium cyclohexanicum]